jgi:hypothetical protein
MYCSSLFLDSTIDMLLGHALSEIYEHVEMVWIWDRSEG